MFVSVLLPLGDRFLTSKVGGPQGHGHRAGWVHFPSNYFSEPRSGWDIDAPFLQASKWVPKHC